MKKLEGKTIYLRPSGNAARGDAKNRISMAVVDKVARVFVTVTIDGGRSQRLRIKDNYLDGGYNSGYEFFKSRDELEDKIFVEQMADKISAKYRYRSDYAKLDRDTITKVAVLLGIEP